MKFFNYIQHLTKSYLYYL